MSADFYSMHEKICKLCQAVWDGYSENWKGRYIDRKVDLHEQVCHYALLNYCHNNDINFSDYFDTKHLILDSLFDEFKDSTRILFDDIENIETEINREVYTIGIAYWLVEQTESFFEKNDIKTYIKKEY